MKYIPDKTNPKRLPLDLLFAVNYLLIFQIIRTGNEDKWKDLLKLYNLISEEKLKIRKKRILKKDKSKRKKDGFAEVITDRYDLFIYFYRINLQGKKKEKVLAKEDKENKEDLTKSIFFENSIIYVRKNENSNENQKEGKN